ncbi:actin-related protein 5 [Stylonychia lemnae]|uniref:Actin-related protein 5 n=1 Tax=Stylonychia lemnae TaxID=5949 RepID=A0A078AEE1_STYLE|nr:actin-related protein 5 [Stylonychia lemnae]|eukprot:CDW79283.1 actin-related protein 5 [Stylonychia lemnae]
MKKLLFDIQQQQLGKSTSVQESRDRYQNNLRQYKSRALNERPTIIIDNGSYECRAGWSFEKDPYLRFRNYVAKPKTSVNKQIDSMHLVGDEINEFDAGKIHKRSMFDKNVVYHVQSLEHMLDYTFGHLGLSQESSIEYPLLLTEPMCNPNYCRSNISELLFECYRISAVSYAVDSLLSFYYNKAQNLGGAFSADSQNGLVISSSYNTTHVIPIIEGGVQLQQTKRLPLGGAHHQELLSKSLNLKYVQHKNNLTSESIQYIQENHTYCPTNYRDQILFLEQVYQEERNYQKEEEKKRQEALYGNVNNPQEPKSLNPQGKDTLGRKLVIYKSRTHKLNDQLGEDEALDKEDHVIQLPWVMESAPTDEEMKRRHEMRKEQGQKLKEIMQRKRDEKKRKMEEELADLQSLESLREQNDLQGFKEEIQQRGISSVDEYKKKVKYLQVKLNIKQSEGKTDEEKYNLIDIQDEFLNPDQLRQKRIQKMQKTATLMREEKKAQMKVEREKIDILKQSDPDAYLKSLYEKRKEILDRMSDRARRKEEFSKRGSKAAQKRMQMIAELGIDDNENNQKKRGRPPLDEKLPPQKDVDESDNFGAADEDWDIYRGIQKDGYSEDEEDDQQVLNELEEQIADLDPKFSNLLYNTSAQPTAEDYQIRLWSDRYRGTEILFQPSIVGLENAGLGEILENIMNGLNNEQKAKILSHVLLTGGNTQVPNFERRIEAELRMINKAGLKINVVKSYDAQLDAWRGGAWLAQNYFFGQSLQEFSISKAQYEECGHHYLKEHFCSNILYGNIPSKYSMGRKNSGILVGENPSKRLKQ